MEATVLDNRALSADLHWLTVAAPALAAAQAGQFVMAHCTAVGSADPLLRRRFWIVDADRTHTATLLVDTTERGGAWLAAQLPGATLDLLGPLGRPIQPTAGQRALLLIAEDLATGALLALAAQASRGGSAVVLLIGAAEARRIPPYVLAPDVEYLATSGDVLALLDSAGPGSRLDTPLLWADQVVAAGSAALAARLAQRIRRDRFNWKPGFALFVLDQPLACGVGLCGGCWHNTRKGDRLLCVAGPALDLRDAV